MLRTDEVRLYSLDLATDDQLDTACLSAEERARAARFVRAGDRHHFEVGRAWLRTLIGRAIDVPPAEVAFVYGTHRKPLLADGRLHFNVSHAADRLVIALCRTHAVGVDIEFMRPLDDLVGMLGQICSPDEAASIATWPDQERLAAFYRGWTRKEAVLKAIGLGLSFPLRDLDVTLAPGEPARLLAMVGHNAAAWELSEWAVPAGFVGAIAHAPAYILKLESPYS